MNPRCIAWCAHPPPPPTPEAAKPLGSPSCVSRAAGDVGRMAVVAEERTWRAGARTSITLCTHRAVPKHATRHLPLPFTMVPSGILRCEPCGCSVRVGSLAQHSSGKKHLQNVAANTTVTPHRSPLPPSNVSNSQPMSLPSASSPAIGVPVSVTSDPRVTVSHEDGLDFVVEGTEHNGQQSFAPVEHHILIAKTQVLSNLSMPILRLVRHSDTPASWCRLFYGVI